MLGLEPAHADPRLGESVAEVRTGTDRGRILAVMVVMLAASPAFAGGQASTERAPPGAGGGPRQTAEPRPVRQVYGRVLHPSGRALEPLGGVWATLHRVGSDSAGPIDSSRTDAQGRFAFTYRPWGTNDAVYFLSSSYQGIAYFSQPLTQAVVRGADAEIIVFDTTSHPIPLHVKGRHLVVAAPTADGWRDVVEVFELANDSSLTLVSRGGGDHPAWAMDLPAEARQFRVGQGDVSADAVAVVRNSVQVFAPFAPGLKQLSFTYQLPSGAFPLARTLTAGATVLEVLVEEPGARAEAPRMRQVASVAMEGRAFARYLAQDVPANAVLRVSVPLVLGSRRTLYIALVITVIGAAMLGALAHAYAWRPTGPPRRAHP